MTTGFPEQLRWFYERHRQGLYSYAISLTRDRATAEEAVQTAIFQVLRLGEPPAELKPYLFRAVRNAAVDRMRGRQRGEAALLDPQLASPVREDPEQVRLVEQCLERLSADERETVVLKIYDGLTFREIAAVRDKPLNTVASWYRRGLERMRQLLEESQ